MNIYFCSAGSFCKIRINSLLIPLTPLSSWRGNFLIECKIKVPTRDACGSLNPLDFKKVAFYLAIDDLFFFGFWSFCSKNIFFFLLRSRLTFCRGFSSGVSVEIPPNNKFLQIHWLYHPKIFCILLIMQIY